MIPVKITQLSTNKNPIHLTLDVGWVEKYKTVNGNPIVISDGVKDTLLKKLQMALTPIQDLHGYDKPWVGGAGKNLFDVSYLTGQSANGVYFTAQNDGRVKASGTAVTQGWTYINRSFTLPYNGIDAGDQILLYGSAQLYVRFYDDTYAQVGSAVTRQPSNTATTIVPSSATKMEIYVYTGYTYPSAGQTVNETLEFYISKDLTFTSWTPYSNICPISGWDEVETVVSGKNLCDNADALLDLGTGVTYSEENGYYFPRHYDTGASHPIFVNEDGLEGQITLSFKQKQSATGQVKGYLYFTYTDGTYGRPIIYPTTANTWFDYSVTSDASKTVANARYGYSSAGGDSWVKDIQIELGSTATTYEPYNGHTYTTDLPQTVYGGTLDVVSGVLTVDRAIVTLDGSADENWSVQASGGHYRAYTYSLTDILPHLSNTQPTSAICNMYEAGTWNDVFGGKPYLGQTGKAIGIGIDGSGITDVTTWNAWLAENPLQIVYPLATPTTIQCDQQTVSLLAGENVIMGDGDMEITYRVKASA